jgi:hypothetical protein
MHDEVRGALPKPLPATGTVPYAARIFYGVEDKGKAYRYARLGLIVTKDAGSRGKIALLHPTARMLGIDPDA